MKKTLILCTLLALLLPFQALADGAPAEEAAPAPNTAETLEQGEVVLASGACEFACQQQRQSCYLACGFDIDCFDSCDAQYWQCIGGCGSSAASAAASLDGEIDFSPAQERAD